jgi:hypothetical protein
MIVEFDGGVAANLLRLADNLVCWTVHLADIDFTLQCLCHFFVRRCQSFAVAAPGCIVLYQPGLAISQSALVVFGIQDDDLAIAVRGWAGVSSASVHSNYRVFIRLCLHKLAELTERSVATVHINVLSIVEAIIRGQEMSKTYETWHNVHYSNMYVGSNDQITQKNPQLERRICSDIVFMANISFNETIDLGKLETLFLL